MLDDHWNAKLGFDHIAQGHLRPAGQVSGSQDHPCLGIDEPRDSNADPAQVGSLVPTVGKQRVDGRE
jgi:hypothetical protein